MGVFHPPVNQFLLYSLFLLIVFQPTEFGPKVANKSTTIIELWTTVSSCQQQASLKCLDANKHMFYLSSLKATLKVLSISDISQNCIAHYGQVQRIASISNKFHMNLIFLVICSARYRLLAGAIFKIQIAAKFRFLACWTKGELCNLKWKEILLRSQLYFVHLPKQ